uniref:NADH dehydrogenase subunit 6 n=1 Tax=Cladiscus yunnanus TaxID=3028309 RepID=UPI0023D8C3D5|nr:NADH dehydrogenase subunit 6 [Cladiscus yunnanus]WDE20697.1 NADH dehydrogenase subunit 6 [Cladiscus yunnanus]
MKFLLLSSLSLSLSIIFLKHPMSLGFILLLQTLNCSLIINLLNYNFWFSYILFLIMIGGMLILFIYMTSIASNEKFMFSNILLSLFLMMMMMFFIIILMDNFIFNLNFINSETLMLNKTFNFSMNMNKYFSFPNFFMFYITIIYLLITLIAVVKISNFNLGPLRQMN